jgi:hypothetical protein
MVLGIMILLIPTAIFLLVGGLLWHYLSAFGVLIYGPFSLAMILIGIGLRQHMRMKLCPLLTTRSNAAA